MDTVWKNSIWNQFGASIDMLANAITACPDSHWDNHTRFWYNAYHALFFLDYYLTLKPAGFQPPSPFTLSEFEDSPPPKVYTKEELLGYLEYCRSKCHQLIKGLTDKTAGSLWTNESRTMSYPVVEILLYNMRHVQHHAAQLNLLLRQGSNEVPDWVFQAKDIL